MDALEEAEDNEPETVFRKGAADCFVNEFGVEAHSKGITRHLTRACSCRPTT